MIKSDWHKGIKQKLILIIGGIVLLLLLFFLRDDYQPTLLFLRKYIFIILLVGLFLWFSLSRFRNTVGALNRVLILLGIVAFFVTLWFFGSKLNLYSYMQTYNAVSYTHLRAHE